MLRLGKINGKAFEGSYTSEGESEQNSEKDNKTLFQQKNTIKMTT